MIRINLLATHEVKKEAKSGWLLKSSVGAFLLLVLAVFLTFWILGNRIQALKEEKTFLESQTRGTLQLQQEIKALKAKKELYQKRLNLLQSLEKERHGPVRLLETIAVILPADQLWLTNLKENGPEIRLDGMSLTNEVLADFLKRLEASGLFQQVDLLQSAQAVYKDLSVKQFSISAWTQAPPPPTAEEKK
jgi:type IV pilus assembly protein PilN